MDPSKENNFEDQWRKVFNDASETPPDWIWARVEAHLDEEEDKIVPLIWWRSPKVWLAAASIAAILIMGGIYLNPRKFNGPEIISQKEISEVPNGEKVARNDNSSTTSEVIRSDKKDNAVLSDSPLLNERDIASVSAPEKTAAYRNELKSAGLLGKAKSNYSVVSENSGSGDLPGAKGDVVSGKAVMESNISEPGEMDARLLNGAVSANELALLSPSEAKELDVYMQKRYVFFKQQSVKEEQVSKKSREYWASLSFMPSAFNPDLKVNSAPQGFATGAYSTVKSTSGTSETGTSFAYQSMGGVNLSKHWSLELGLSYLQGNSTYEGGGYLLSSVYNGKAANVLESAYADLNNKNSQGVANPSQGFSNGLNSVYIDVTKNIQNNYQYLQMPVQAGYTLNPQGKLSYGVLGGLMTNFFLKNEIESANGNTITTTASDDVYKSVNLAATTGLRLSYRFSSKWKANLTGSYQKSLNSAIKSNQSIDAHPYLYGVSWGVRYTF